MTGTFSPFAAGGQDLGANWSKLALACSLGGTPDELPVVTRVGFRGSVSHPEQPHGMTRSKYEFVATAALSEGKLIWGQRALKTDNNFSLKTILLVCSGIVRRETLNKTADGLELLELFQLGIVTLLMMEMVLVDHFQFLHDLLLTHLKTQAQNKQHDLQSILRMCLSYPNFLCPCEGAEDFRLYTQCYLRLMRKVWGAVVQFFFASEGQSAALYITEPFRDMGDSYDRARLLEKLMSGRGDGGYRVQIFDGGSSSVNVQTQQMFLNAAGDLLHSQSINDNGWASGVQGGSNVTNATIRFMLKQTYGEKLEPGELATILANFEMQKGNIDWSDESQRPLILVGSQQDVMYPIFPSALYNAFRKAFNAGLELLENEVHHVASAGQDFTVVFCGGSYFCNGLTLKVEELMEKLAVVCFALHGVRVRHFFLADYDQDSCTAVAVGSVLSVMRMPPPSQILEGSAIGLHLCWAESSTPDVFVGEEFAHFLYCEGHLRGIPSGAYSLTIWNGPSNGVGPVKGEILKLALVCDPAYYPKRPVEAGGDRLATVRTLQDESATFKPLAISNLKESRGLPAVYDLDFSIPGDNIPPGLVSIAVMGPYAIQSADTTGPQSDSPFLVFELNCIKVSTAGKRLRHALDKRWLLRIVTDPATKLLTVEEEKKLPVWCHLCREWIGSRVAYFCQLCSGALGLCLKCSSAPIGHITHSITHTAIWTPICMNAFSPAPAESFKQPGSESSPYHTRGTAKRVRRDGEGRCPDVAPGAPSKSAQHQQGRVPRRPRRLPEMLEQNKLHIEGQAQNSDASRISRRVWPSVRRPAVDQEEEHGRKEEDSDTASL